jgi:hypothetical protein
MRRNMDLARKILFALEECPFTCGWHIIQIDGYSSEDISNHVLLLKEAGFIDARELTNLSSPHPEWYPERITWDGHEFLDSSRDETRWEKAKSLIRDKGTPMTLEALKLVMSELIRQTLLAHFPR